MYVEHVEYSEYAEYAECMQNKEIAKIMQEICRKYEKNMYKIRKKNYHKRKICSKYEGKNVYQAHRICRKNAGKMQEICIIYITYAKCA